MSRPPEDQRPSNDVDRDDGAARHDDGAPHDETWHQDERGWFASEHDETLADDVLATGAYPDDPDLHAEVHEPRTRKHHNPALRLTAILAALVIVIGGGYFGARAVADLIPSFDLASGSPDDFEGEGTGEVTVEIPEGAGGHEIGHALAESGVVASAEAFANLAAADPRATGIQPGQYLMAREMSASAALDRLLDPQARQVAQVTVREGLWVSEVFAVLAEQTGNEVEDYEAVDPESLPLPEAADGELEGYLAPDTYAFAPGSSAEEQLRAMVELGNQRYETLEVPEDELAETLTIASLIQAEAAASDDLPKVSRVIRNRLEDEEPLGFDSTIHFIAQERGLVGTTDEQRGVDDPYNTYQNAGLPPGPINSPGVAAIEAAMNPAEGDWMYFVTVNPDTGETVFTETFEEHQEQVDIFLEWCEDNPDSC